MEVQLMSDKPVAGEAFWERVRAAYPEQRPLLNLNNAAVSPPPLVVEQAMIDAYRLISQNPDVNMWSKLDAELPAIKQQLADMADCDPDEIALNRNSSEGLSTAIFGIPLKAGDQVLVSLWDYPSVIAGWLQRQQREGIEVVTVDFDLMDDEHVIVQAYAQAITPRTRVIQLTTCSLDRAGPAGQAHLCAGPGAGDHHGGGRCADFAQMPLSFRELGCDYFVTSLHKWLGAPVGNGMLIVRCDRDRQHLAVAGTFRPSAATDRQVRPLESRHL